MDVRIHGTPGPPRPRRPHGWIHYDEFLTLHLSWLRTLEREGIVLDDTLSHFEQHSADGRLVRVVVRGRIRCVRGVTLQIEEQLEARPRRDGRTEVRARHRTYHAWRAAGGERRLLFRYDSSHGAPLHLHAADPSTGEETSRIEVPPRELPNLDQLIRYAAELAARAR